MKKPVKPLKRTRFGNTHHRKPPDEPPKPGMKRVKVAFPTGNSRVQGVMGVTLPAAPWERSVDTDDTE